MSVSLHHRVDGQGPPLILLHGLFGSLENLGGIAQRLSDQWRVHALDLRNHGRSPHSDTMDYPAMAADVKAYMDDAGLDRASVLGHSMGGKVAMELALTWPHSVDRLVVADIAPVAYPPRHDAILDGLMSLDTAALRSRRDADERLAEKVSTPAVRQFLLKNLVRRREGGFGWRMNLPVIADQYEAIAAAPSASGPFTRPTLFIKGAASDYIGEEAREPTTRLFPAASLRMIPETGHWLHAEKPDRFANTVRRFLCAELDRP
ncbi:alpha/beta fold hydrolase [Tamilnaduibacter salinus]|uniref:alpha/beta fold hydrolase n=1 Tax=Tamilnaduibacter salinus TaxID=1484056 RepID=UPI000E3291F6|nr:alpha/beta fold hydrolase [Tamilnaduibacter salinus]